MVRSVCLKIRVERQRELCWMTELIETFNSEEKMAEKCLVLLFGVNSFDFHFFLVLDSDVAFVLQ